MKAIRSIFLIALAAALPVLAADAPAPQTFSIDKAHSDVSFRVRHMMSNVRGAFDDFDGMINIDRTNLANSTVNFTIQAKSVDTRNENRDNHLRSGDFFDVEKFPTITFKSKKITAAGKDQYNVVGDFTMHGVTKEITIPVRSFGFANDGRGGVKTGFEITTTLNRKDYGIVWNKAIDNGTLLGDDVEVAINIEANAK
ncbi:MAG TPA: YceI family protein [Thermoanaerobaculia bacterium]|nr:YceI family protein [Thermoanaerobaculia bacterium]